MPYALPNASRRVRTTCRSRDTYFEAGRTACTTPGHLRVAGRASRASEDHELVLVPASGAPIRGSQRSCHRRVAVLKSQNRKAVNSKRTVRRKNQGDGSQEGRVWLQRKKRRVAGPRYTRIKIRTNGVEGWVTPNTGQMVFFEAVRCAAELRWSTPSDTF